MMRQLIFLWGIWVLVGCGNSIVVVPMFEAVESDRVVLLEEMTGVSCPNCPKGTAEVEALKELYGEQVIPVGIHGFFLSWPTKESEFDFRNDFAKELEMNLAPGTSKPAALVNRTVQAGEASAVVQSPELWAGYVEAELNKPPQVGIALEILRDARELSIKAGILGLDNVVGGLKISVMILENNIVDAQEDLNDIIEDFQHNHVLRTMLTPYDGEVLVDGLERDEVVNKSYLFQVPEDEHLWKMDDLEVVVFVHTGDVGGEVLQAAMAKVGE